MNLAAAAAGKPADTSAGVSTCMRGVPLRATAANPSVVEKVKGIENHASPPRR